MQITYGLVIIMGIASMFLTFVVYESPWGVISYPTQSIQGLLGGLLGLYWSFKDENKARRLLVPFIGINVLIDLGLSYDQDDAISLTTGVYLLYIPILISAYVYRKQYIIPTSIGMVGGFIAVFNHYHPDLGTINRGGYLLSVLVALATSTALLFFLRGVLDERNDELKHSNKELETKTQSLETMNNKLIRQAEALAIANKELESINTILDQQRGELAFANARLTKANQHIQQLKDIQTHEMIQPLAGTESALALILEDEELAENHRELLGKAQDNLTMLNAVVAGDYTPIQRRSKVKQQHSAKQITRARRTTQERESVDANKMVKTSKLLRHYIDHPILRNKIIEYDYQSWEQDMHDLSHFKEYVPFKMPEIYGICNNLMKNAARFMTEGGGVITFISGVIATDFYIFISDTGKGMKENSNNLFEIYKKRETSTGSGIGLGVVKEIVENHGGKINISSKLGTGTTFLITLPIPQRTILYFEDDDLLRETFETNINKIAGYTVQTFSVADDWQLLIEKHQPQIVFLDIDLAGSKFGGDAVMELAGPLYPGIKFIAHTANTTDYNLELYRSLGFDGFIGKPANPEIIRQCLIKAETDQSLWFV